MNPTTAPRCRCATWQSWACSTPRRSSDEPENTTPRRAVAAASRRPLSWAGYQPCATASRQARFASFFNSRSPVAALAQGPSLRAYRCACAPPDTCFPPHFLARQPAPLAHDGAGPPGIAWSPPRRRWLRASRARSGGRPHRIAVARILARRGTRVDPFPRPGADDRERGSPLAARAQ